MSGGRGHGRGGERVGDLADLSVGVEDDGEGRVTGGDDHIATLESVMYGEAHGSTSGLGMGETRGGRALASAAVSVLVHIVNATSLPRWCRWGVRSWERPSVGAGVSVGRIRGYGRRAVPLARRRWPVAVYQSDGPRRRWVDVAAAAARGTPPSLSPRCGVAVIADGARTVGGGRRRAQVHRASPLRAVVVIRAWVGTSNPLRRASSRWRRSWSRRGRPRSMACRSTVSRAPFT